MQSGHAGACFAKGLDGFLTIFDDFAPPCGRPFFVSQIDSRKRHLKTQKNDAEMFFVGFRSVLGALMEGTNVALF